MAGMPVVCHIPQASLAQVTTDIIDGFTLTSASTFTTGVECTLKNTNAKFIALVYAK